MVRLTHAGRTGHQGREGGETDMWVKRALNWAKSLFRANRPMLDENGHIVQSWTL